eukprot:PLAT11370.1.p1 GENE.PLAT11370.1~~PLAT11370.1.p1  ORF type:complete len:277 (-),score=105.13 PLAT11370.1:171-1001(-)
MEEFDDIIQKPDASGAVDLSHRAIRLVDEVVWTWTERIVTLDISYNEITALPPALGDLRMLRELDASHNELLRLPKSIGRCLVLTLLNVSHNKLTSLPHEIGECEALTLLDASHNRLEEMPREVGKLSRLRTLMMQENHIELVPSTLRDCRALLALDLTGNALRNLPGPIQKDVASVLWLCDVLKTHEDDMEDMVGLARELEGLALTRDLQKMEMIERMAVLEEENERLKAEFPDKYVAVKRRITHIRAASKAKAKARARARAKAGKTRSSACAVM